MREALFTVLAIMILLIFGLPALQGGLYDSAENTGNETTITNETFTVNHDTITQLNDSDIDRAVYTDNTTVYQSGSEYEQGVDYIWYRGNGTVEPLSSGDLTNNTDANITYSYHYTTETQNRVTNMASVFTRVNAQFVIVLMLFFIGAVAVMARRNA